MSSSGATGTQTEITIRLFASLRETLGLAEFQFDLSVIDDEPTVAKVRQLLLAKHGKDWLALESADVRIAVNQSVVNELTSLQAGDELAFFPPVTGG